MSTTTNITCPECSTVLRPAKPLRAGKSVKCPKCGAGFVVGGERESRGGSAGGQIKPAAAAAPAKKKPAPVAPIMPDDDDDDGGGGTYGFVSEEKTEAPEVDYAPDVGIRDLRGPAMMEIVNPSNKMIFAGVFGFLGWLGFLVILLIPLLFPLATKEERAKEREIKEKARQMAKANGPKDTVTKEDPPKKDDDDDSILKIGDLDLRDIAELPWYLIVLCLMPQVLGMIYCATLSVGAVKIQNLESREWGVAASIMAMVPLNVGGLICVAAMVLNLLLGLLFDDWFKWVVVGFLLVCIWGLSLAVGIWNLTVLNKPDVIAGFEYVAE